MSTERRIRFNDVTASYQEQREEIDAAIARTVQRGDFINGSAVKEFEKAFALYCGAGFAVGASNGTSALHMALSAAGVGEGDEVITTPMTFIASAEAITHTGARVVFADIDPETLNLSPEQVEARLTPRTRAILFVHLHGNPSGVLETARLARERGLVLVEDCAQAHGARVDTPGQPGVHVGNFGQAAAFSFFPAKNLGAFGDAGAVLTNDVQLAERARMLANHGRQEKYIHQIEGYNYRLDTLQAAILAVKLTHLEAQVERRVALAERYETQLQGLDLSFQRKRPGLRHARHLLVVQTPERDGLQKHLRALGIETGIHYPLPLHLQPAYAYLGYKEGSFPVAEHTAKTSLSLPFYPQMQEEDVDFVCHSVREFFGTK